MTSGEENGPAGTDEDTAASPAISGERLAEESGLSQSISEEEVDQDQLVSAILDEIDPDASSTTREAFATEVAQITTTALRMTEKYEGTFAAPLPPPSLLAGYERLHEGAIGKMFQWAEDEAKHRRSIERTVVNGNNIRAYLGQGAAFVITMVLTFVGADLIRDGHDFAGTALVTTTLLGLVTTFILGRKWSRERTQNQRNDDAS